MVTSFSYCQRDSISRESMFNYENSIFYLTQQSWKANQRPSTGSVPLVVPIEERKIPLQSGEGASSNLYLLEADLNLMYPLFWGRKDSNGGSFSKLNLFTFDYGFNFRMTLDDSKPLTPPSNRVGFSWTHNLYNNYSGWSKMAYGKSITDSEFQIGTKNFYFWNTLIQLHHYSNGQSGDSNITVGNYNRNNYENGDFSTNYLYGQITYGRYLIPSFSLLQFSLGYRVDLGSENGSLAYSKDQNLAYGRHRLKFIVDNWSSIKQFPFSKSSVSYHTRIETQVTVDDLKNFEANNYTTNKYPWNIRAMLEVNPKVNRSIGFFIAGYYGRDYLNIRYDDIVFVTQLGLTLSLDKYYANFLKKTS